MTPGERALVLGQQLSSARDDLQAAYARVKELEAKLAAAESKLAAVREYVFDTSFDSFYHNGFREILDR